MLDVGVIKFFKFFWVFFIVIVCKLDGFIRFCVNYCKVNEVIIKDLYFLFRINDFFDVLCGFLWFFVLDLQLGFWEVKMDLVD